MGLAKVAWGIPCHIKKNLPWDKAAEQENNGVNKCKRKHGWLGGGGAFYVFFETAVFTLKMEHHHNDLERTEDGWENGKQRMNVNGSFLCVVISVSSEEWEFIYKAMKKGSWHF